MGRPAAKPPRPAGLRRRDFFKRSGSSAALLAGAAVLPAALARSHVSMGAFQHGVASGDPLADRVILWTRVTPSDARAWVRVRFLVSLDPAFAQMAASGTVITGPERDHTVKVDATGLSAGTTYYYRFEFDGEYSPIGRTRTLPVGRVDRLRIAVASCSNHAAGYFNAYRHIAARADLDLLLHLGDYLYEYGSDEYGSVRPTDPPHEMVTLADYRQRHAQYKRDPDLQAAHRQHPMIAIWDDHEIANDAWRGGAQNHAEGDEGTWSERVAFGLQAYHEWMPVREFRRADPRRNQRAFRLGDLADLIMLEERLQARSRQLDATIPVPGFGHGFTQTGAFADPSRTLLGDAQEAWLAARLRGSEARWKLLGQGVMFGQLKALGLPRSRGGGLFLNPDQWDGYEPARDRVFDVLQGRSGRRPVNDVVVLTGDIHSSWANDLTPDPNNPDPRRGGYDPATGAGSAAVEFVTTSISSPGLDDPVGEAAVLVYGANPHVKYVDFNQRGYLLLDVTPERVVGEWWYIDTVAALSEVQTFGAAFEVRAGQPWLLPSAATTPRESAPPLAP